MNRFISYGYVILIVVGAVSTARGQSQEDANQFLDQFNQHFQYASRVLELAKAMPSDKFSWQPGEGVSSFEEVCMHVARYNYYYLEHSLGIPAPSDKNLDEIESITGKRQVVAELEESIQHVKSAMKELPRSKLTETTTLYGNDVNGQAVLMQLITHMSEHVGQAIAYARMNNVVPPWNR